MERNASFKNVVKKLLKKFTNIHHAELMWYQIKQMTPTPFLQQKKQLLH